MGFRFRKSFGKGPFRVNLSKSGIGYSVGGKAFRVTKKAGGGTRTTASIPGTGISYTKDHGSSKTHSASRIVDSAIVPSDSDHGYTPDPSVNMTELLLCLFLGWAGAHKFYRKKKGMGVLYLLTFGLCLIGWWGDAIQMIINFFSKNQTAKRPILQKALSYFAAFLCVMVVGGCSSSGDPAPEASEPVSRAVTTITEATETATEAPATLATIASTEAATEPETTEATTEATTESTTEPTTVPTTEATTEPETEAPTEPVFTYILNTNTKKFHKPTCSSVHDIKDKNKKEITTTREDVISRGYDPCGRCHP